MRQCLGPTGSFISPQPQTHRPEAVLSLLLEILPLGDKCPLYMHLLEHAVRGGVLVAGQGAGEGSGILSSEKGP